MLHKIYIYTYIYTYLYMYTNIYVYIYMHITSQNKHIITATTKPVIAQPHNNKTKQFQLYYTFPG